MRIRSVAWVLALVLAAAPALAAPPSLVPKPLAMQARKGAFPLVDGTPIVVPGGDAEALRSAEVLASQLSVALGLHLPVRQKGPAKGAIVLRLDPHARMAQDEGYVLDVAPGGVVVRARNRHGLFNGTMSLLQLATHGGRGDARVPAVHIEDAPRFRWRGMMLDSARHMQPVDFIKSYIDAMALHKLDVLQWHLTDDQGWRLQIRKYPKLTEIGAWRRPAGRAGTDANGNPVRYGGFYTQDQVREIVAYAAARYITVVPEIDMPGHAQAALAAYPEFGVTGNVPPVSPDWGVHEYLFNVDEPTIRFLEDVLVETMELFPSKFIHVGGDEAVKTQWKNSPQVQTRMKALGIADEAHMQSWLTEHMQQFLAAHGRRLIGWDEILEGGLPADAAVMSWQGTKGAVAATMAGHDSVLAPWPLLYFDNRQSTSHEEPAGRIRVVSLEDVYRFDPLPSSMTPAQAAHLLGVQGNVWTEHIRTTDEVDWMSFPRAAAVAEMGWTAPAQRQWDDFLGRMPGLLASYRALHVYHADSAFAVQAIREYSGTPLQAKVTLSTQSGLGEIHYTLDNTDPSPSSPKYDGPLSLPLPSKLQVASFLGEQRLSNASGIELRPDQVQLRAASELKLCTENIAIGVDGHAPDPARITFPIDIQNPCWIFEGADLDRADRFTAVVGNIPFNFQIGDLVDKIQFAKPTTDIGELLVLQDSCDGPELARLPLPSSLDQNGLAKLAPMSLAVAGGHHDLCLRFAQPSLQPMWALYAAQLLDREK